MGGIIRKYIPAMSGSILGASVISVPSAFAALDRNSSLVVSARDLANVLCSCGRKGFKDRGIFSSKLLSVSKMAPPLS